MKTKSIWQDRDLSGHVRRLRNCKLYEARQSRGLLHLGGRCSLHLCRIKASSIAFDGKLGTISSPRTKGCDHAQSEHLQFADAFVGKRIFRVVSVIHPPRSLRLRVLFGRYQSPLPPVPILGNNHSLEPCRSPSLPAQRKCRCRNHHSNSLPLNAAMKSEEFRVTIRSMRRDKDRKSA